MHSIPSPYNFVPLSKEVFFPDWANKVSMDVPFSDGISGKLSIEVKAVTPIYIRNGGTFPEKNEEKNKIPDFTDFFKMGPDSKYYIPGTSLKGMLRNIVEIISFGKIAHQVDDSRFGFRDLYNRQYTGEITDTIRNREYESKAKSGWLCKDGKKWYITPCEYARVEQQALEKYYSQTYNKRIAIGTRREEAKDKYKKWGKDLILKCRTDMIEQQYDHTCGKLYYKKVHELGAGNTTGTLVFTGQPMKWEPGKNRRKHMEFIFYEKASNPIEISSKLFKEFDFVHTDENEKPLHVWEFWKDKIEKDDQQAPVFYLEDDKGDISSIGLAQMYRLPCKTSIHEAIKNTSKKHLDDSRLDLAQLIFGYVQGEKALRGRVQVGHLLCTGNPVSTEKMEIIPGSPKPTYYPNYIKQSIGTNNRVSGEYTTLMDKHAEIRGWKRYPVKKKKVLPPVSKENEKIITCFKTLAENTSFKGNIAVHNLKAVELGALLWALTWGGDNKLKHNIGMAKAYGFGQVEISITGCQLTNMSGETISTDNLVSKFETEMENEKAISSWRRSKQVKELLAMADPEKSKTLNLCYPQLKNQQNRGKNDFTLYKDKHHRMVLLSYTEYSGGTNTGYKSIRTDRGRNGQYGVIPAGNITQQRHKVGDKVRCIVLEEKTKKGGWRLRIVGGIEEDRGVIQPQAVSSNPGDIAPGKEYDMVIAVYASDNCQFRWV